MEVRIDKKIQQSAPALLEAVASGSASPNPPFEHAVHPKHWQKRTKHSAISRTATPNRQTENNQPALRYGESGNYVCTQSCVRAGGLIEEARRYFDR